MNYRLSAFPLHHQTKKKPPAHILSLRPPGKVPPQDPSDGELHADEPLSEHAVLRVAGRAQPARRGRDDDPAARAHEAVR